MVKLVAEGVTVLAMSYLPKVGTYIFKCSAALQTTAKSLGNSLPRCRLAA